MHRRAFSRALASLAAVPVSLPALAAPRSISGTVGYRERMALPRGAEIVVHLLDVSLADAPARTIARTRVVPRGQVPVPYRLSFDDSAIRRGRRYALRAEILVGRDLWFTTTEHHAAFGPEARTDILVHRVARREPEPARPAGPYGSWRVETLGGRPVPGAVNATLRIDPDGRVSGNGGCNGMGGQATIRGETIRFGQMVGTMMACPEPRMTVERNIHRALTETRGWRLQHGSLVLLGAGNRRLMTLVSA